MTKIARFTLAVLAALLAAALPRSVAAQASAAALADEPFVVEYYYKARWGFAEEFIRLFRKNHYPVLERQKQKGLILDIRAEAPRYHGTEDGRWDYRVTLTWKNFEAGGDRNRLTDAELRTLYPDKAAFDKEEQRRFEILLAHWDLPLVPVRLAP